MGASRSTGWSAPRLRAAGYIPLPRLWVKPEDLEEILKIASRHKEDVNDIRGAARRAAFGDPDHLEEDAKTDKDAAWELFEKRRGNGS